MVAPQRLLAHLSSRLADHPENIAVEALAFILTGSPAMREAFNSTLQSLGLDLPAILSFQAQATGPDATRPDLAGYGADGKEHVLVEAKFWAGLTEQQPVAYLDRLSATPSGNAALVVIAPALRLESLWAELLHLCSLSDHYPQLRVLSTAGDVRAAHVAERVTLVLMTWRQVLGALLGRASADGDTSVASDVLQLQSLAEQMDAEAFLPVRSIEMGQDLPRRIVGLTSLVDDVVTRAVANGVLRVDGLRATPRSMGYGRYVWIGKTGAWLGVSFEWWARYRQTPLWLQIQSWPGDPESIVLKRVRLTELEHAMPPRLIADSGALLVPLFLPIGVERDAVVADLLSQIDQVASLESRTSPSQIGGVSEA